MLHEVESHPEAAPDVRASAATLRRRLERRLARLTIEVERAPEDASIVLDATELPIEAAGVALPVDPGAHLVRLVAGDDELAQEHIQLEAGASGEVRILGPSDTGGSILASPWFWTAAGVVVVAGAVAAVLLLTADDEPDSSGGALVTF